ncbi:hypothetical protein [Blastococcus sp. TF02A-35]|uniref:hypothetical protein n=1 Tax=Blastococcus sp. TF02A-35 TaxID=2559612 RepID=UPI00107305DF|nr:hypothetical protein [Blastococcus sp. TF02A_35]TFV52956.1 hypothetical protein E4P43_03420 [Blastococcus sp. TF02A_35]
MSRRSPAQARFLGLWSAAWLAVLLVLGMLRFGDPAVQWPVLLVPAVWALVALRPRRRSRMAVVERERPPRRQRPVDDGWAEDDRHPADERYDDRYDERYDGYDDDPPALPPGMRTDTVERPALRRRQDPYEDDGRW